MLSRNSYPEMSASVSAVLASSTQSVPEELTSLMTMVLACVSAFAAGAFRSGAIASVLLSPCAASIAAPMALLSPCDALSAAPMALLSFCDALSAALCAASASADPAASCVCKASSAAPCAASSAAPCAVVSSAAPCMLSAALYLLLRSRCCSRSVQPLLSAGSPAPVHLLPHRQSPSRRPASSLLRRRKP